MAFPGMVKNLFRPTGMGSCLSVWGGFAVHQQSAGDAGEPVLVGCEFDGVVAKVQPGQAVNANGGQLNYDIDDDSLAFQDDEQLCAGFGRMPSAMKRVRKE